MQASDPSLSSRNSEAISVQDSRRAWALVRPEHCSIVGIDGLDCGGMWGGTCGKRDGE
jgi:hypothetical protein